MAETTTDGRRVPAAGRVRYDFVNLSSYNYRYQRTKVQKTDSHTAPVLFFYINLSAG